LHPSVREARKSVARELVCLQEKLDTLCKQQSGEFDHTNSDEEKSERTKNVIQIAGPTVTEACDKVSIAYIIMSVTLFCCCPIKNVYTSMIQQSFFEMLILKEISGGENCGTG
jgi:hypothetical protein